MSFGIGNRPAILNLAGKGSPSPTAYNTTKYSSFSQSLKDQIHVIKYVIPKSGSK